MDIQSIITRWAVPIATIVGVLFTAAGIVSASIQYHKNSEASQAKETLDFQKRYYESPVSVSNERINLLWDAIARELPGREQLPGFNHDKFIVCAYIIGFTQEREKGSKNDPEKNGCEGEYAKDNGLEGDAAILAGFFENLHACTCSDLCDPALVKQFFARHAQTLYMNMSPYIQHRVQKEPGFGDGLHLLANAADKNSDLRKVACLGPS